MNVGIALFGPLKLAFAVILVVAGVSVSGVMAALVLTAATLLFVTGIPVHRDVGKGDAGSPPHLRLAHTFPVLVANVAFSMMTQADMVLVKNLFSPQDAGLYASASVLGKAVIYLPGAIVLALFPMVAESNALRISSGSLLRKALVITLALSGGMALALLLFPALVVETLYGVRYLDAAGILKFFGLAMLPMAAPRSRCASSGDARRRPSTGGGEPGTGHADC